MRLIDLVAPTQRPVLICGPSGCGKEVVAQLVHRRSTDPQAPFVDLNCGAIPEHLVEAELFGHVKGAFTGAAASRHGHFEMAGNGTLFLDEIGELPMALQPKLLRVLETHAYRPIGASENRRFAGRIIAATHCDLKAMVKAGTFREDLYYRLAVLVLDVPGLEQRREDIPALIAHFIARQPRRLSLTPCAIERLCLHPWPGQVRELRNVIERIAILSESDVIDASGLEAFLPHARSTAPSRAALAQAIMELDGEDKLAVAETLLIEHALDLAHGNKTLAARALGVSRKCVERRLQARADQCHSAGSMLEEGRKLIDSASFRPAIGVLERGLQLLAGLAPDPRQLRLRLEHCRLLAVSHRGVDGWQSVQARACYEAALGHARELGDEAELTALLFGIWTTQLMALELTHARATAQEMLQRAQMMGDTQLQAQAHFALANTLFWLGDNQEALASLERRALVGKRAVAGPNHQGLDFEGLSLMIEALAAFHLGQFRRARVAWDGLLLRGAPSNPHFFNRAIALQGAAWMACLFGDEVRLGALGAELEDLAGVHGFVFYRGVGQVFRGCHLMACARHAEAEQAMKQGYEQHMLCEGGKLFHSFHAWKRGELLLRSGRASDSVRLVTQALDRALEYQERAYLVELLEVRARAWLALGDAASAERELRNALSSALALGAAAAHLGVAVHLAQLLANAGRCPEAVDVLARALRGIEQDKAVPQISQAVRLLDELEKAPLLILM